MAKEQITLYMCSTKIPGIVKVGDDLNRSISTSYDEDTAKAIISVPLKEIDPLCFTGKVSKLDVFVFDDGVNPLECLWPGIAELEWIRGLDSYAGISSTVKLHNFLTIEWTNPVGKCAGCFWWESIVGALDQDTFTPKMPWILSTGRKWAPLEKGRIPTTGEKEDNWIYPVPELDVHYEEQPNLIPGGNIALWWSVKIEGSVYQQLMAERYFSTPLMTGAKILSRSGDDDSIHKTYTVETEGGTYSGVMPTDFAQYDIGSWVYLLKQGGPGDLYERRNTYDDEDGSGSIRLVPLNFSGGPTLGGDFEKIGFDLAVNFEESFELSSFEGTILSVTDDTAEVEVTITPDEKSSYVRTFSNVPIFYHCGNMAITSGGGTAFEVGDNVIVLNESVKGNITADDLSIIGFTSELKECTTKYLHITIVGTVCIIWDLDLGAMAVDVIRNDLVVATFPCLSADVSDWVASKSIFGDPAISRVARSAVPLDIPLGILDSEVIGDCIFHTSEASENTAFSAVDETGVGGHSYTGSRQTSSRSDILSGFQWVSEDIVSFDTPLRANNIPNFDIQSLSNYPTNKLRGRAVSYSFGKTTDWQMCYAVPSCMSCGSPGNDITQVTSFQTYEFKSPFSDAGVFSINLSGDSLWNSSIEQPGTCSSASSDSQVIHLSSYGANGVMGDIDFPYMMVYYAEHIKSKNTYKDCAFKEKASGGTSKECPYSEVLLDFPDCSDSGTDSYTEERSYTLKAFLQGTPGDPQDLNPFDLLGNNSLSTAMVSLKDFFESIYGLPAEDEVSPTSFLTEFLK